MKCEMKKSSFERTEILKCHRMAEVKDLSKKLSEPKCALWARGWIPPRGMFWSIPGIGSAADMSGRVDILDPGIRLL